MATYQQKVECEEHVRRLLSEAGLPEPDAVEYGYTCIRFIFEGAKMCLRIDIDEDPEWDYDKGTPQPGPAQR